VSHSFLKRWFRGGVLSWFDRVFPVSAADAAFFRDTYRLPDAKLEVTGDTKYDRVRERALAKAPEAVAWRARLAPSAAGRRRLIVGSAHPADCEALAAAMAAYPGWRDRWQIIVAPHHVQPEKITQMLAILRSTAPQRFTAWTGSPFDVLVLDTMGMLADVYGACDAAFVGGAMHHQVHNVLEPACHGLALAFGPFYKNSQEAVLLADASLAAVINDGGELAQWWQGLTRRDDAPARAALQAAVAELCGASDKILAAWRL
jgi:3-deoxy-D-manno-octulosonic-acid transferase